MWLYTVRSTVERSVLQGVRSAKNKARPGRAGRLTLLFVKDLLRWSALILLLVLMFIRNVCREAQLFVGLTQQLLGVCSMTFKLAVVSALRIGDAVVGLHNKILCGGEIPMTVRIDIHVGC